MKEKVLKLIQMEKSMKVTFIKDILKEMAFGFIQIKVNQKDFGKKVKKMGKQRKLCQMDIYMRQFIIMEKKQTENLWQNS